MSTFWPTAAAACWVARSLGRSSRSRYVLPVAVALGDPLGLELGARVGLGVHHVVVALAALRGGATGVAQQTRVGAARGGHQLRVRRDRGLPIEDDAIALPDHDGGARGRAGAEQ